MLLDTHVWIWLTLGAADLSFKAIEKIRPFVNNHALYISAITLFELAYASQGGRIALPIPVERWFAEVFSRPAPRVVPITTEITVASTRLPADLHGDPADRLIAATAMAHDLILCTHDGHILRHSQAGAYRTLEV